MRICVAKSFFQSHTYYNYRPNRYNSMNRLTTTPIIVTACLLFVSACSLQDSREMNENATRVRYVQYLNEYWNGGDASNIDSALKYNVQLLEGGTANIIDYHYRVQMLELRGLYDSILSLVDDMPDNLVSWPPEYRLYLRLKCKAVMALNVADTCRYRELLHGIVEHWKPLMMDSLAKADTLFSKPMDSIPDHLLLPYIEYYQLISILYGKAAVGQILSSKKDRFNWNQETYSFVMPSDGE